MSINATLAVKQRNIEVVHNLNIMLVLATHLVCIAFQLVAQGCVMLLVSSM